MATNELRLWLVAAEVGRVEARAGARHGRQVRRRAGFVALARWRDWVSRLRRPRRRSRLSEVEGAVARAGR